MKPPQFLALSLACALCACLHPVFVGDLKLTETAAMNFFANVLHLLGLDPEKLTYYHNGARRRLSDVHGRVFKKILAQPRPITP